MKRFRFDPDGDLIRISAIAWGPRRHMNLTLALDTGATETLLTPRVIALLGYDERDAVRRTVIRSALGSERGYLLHIARFTSLGFSIAAFPVHAHALPPDHGIDGLIGLSFLRNFNYEVRSLEGQIRVERAAAA